MNIKNKIINLRNFQLRKNLKIERLSYHMEHMIFHYAHGSLEGSKKFGDVLVASITAENL